MASATVDARPRAPDALGRGAMLALLVHGLLVVALALGVSWRTREADGVVAELWSSVPQIAAPRVAAPPPAPAPPPKVEPRPAPPAPTAAERSDAQIAIERARREAEEREAQRRAQEAQREAARVQAEREAAAEKAARDKADALKREQAAREKEAADKQRRDQAALDAQRDANLKRMQGQAAGEPEGSGTAARTSGPSASYAGRIRARVKPNIVFPDDVPGNPTAIVEVRCAPDGTIVSRKVVKSSGAPAWDDAVLRAIDKTEVLPRDDDGRVPSPMQLEFRPRD
jgi:colicin import membrane protein